MIEGAVVHGIKYEASWLESFRPWLDILAWRAALSSTSSGGGGGSLGFKTILYSLRLGHLFLSSYHSKPFIDKNSNLQISPSPPLATIPCSSIFDGG